MKTALLVFVFFGALTLNNTTQLTFWHTYTNPKGEVHYAFDLKNYNRGVFVGSCGPSTHSLQWEYAFDLKGKGPSYSKDEIKVTTQTDFTPRVVESGAIEVDKKKETVKIAIRISNGDKVTDFIGNGTYKIHYASK